MGILYLCSLFGTIWLYVIFHGLQYVVNTCCVLVAAAGVLLSCSCVSLLAGPVWWCLVLLGSGRGPEFMLRGACVQYRALACSLLHGYPGSWVAAHFITAVIEVAIPHCYLARLCTGCSVVCGLLPCHLQR